MRFNHGIMVVDRETQARVLHFKGFEDPPTRVDWEETEQELREEPMADLLSEWDYVLKTAPSSLVEYFQATFGEWIEHV